MGIVKRDKTETNSDITANLKAVHESDAPPSHQEAQSVTHERTEAKPDADSKNSNSYETGIEELAKSTSDSETRSSAIPTRNIKKKKPKHYFLDNSQEWLMKVTKDGDGNEKTARVCRAMLVKEIRVNDSTNEQTCILRFRLKNNEWVEKEISRELLQKQNFGQLLKYGLDIVGEKMNHAILYIDQEEENTPFVVVHTTLGWGIHNGKSVFKLYTAIGCASTYVGKLNVKPNGTLVGWLVLVKKDIIGNVYLELALVMGFSSAVVAMLRSHTLIDVLLFHLYGNSTEGKTTATRVAVSVYGYPHTKGNGLIKTFAGTPNAMLGHLKDNYGVTMGIDESSIQSGEDFTKFIYTVVNGRDKDRMNASSEMKDTAEFSTTLITNGEHSLIAKSNQNIGLRVRAFEFGNIKWTTSAENADTISDGLMNEYGTAGPAFVKYLMSIGESVVKEKWEKWCKVCFDSMPTIDKFSPRISRKIALIMVTAELVVECFNLSLNIKGILDLLITTEEKNIESRDIGKNAYDFLLEECYRYQSSFSSEINNTSTPSQGFQRLGSMAYDECNRHELIIMPSVLKETLAKGGFQDTDVILKDWRERGWLDCDDKKFTRKRKVPWLNESRRVYVIKIFSESNKKVNNTAEERKQQARLKALENQKGTKEMDSLFSKSEEDE